MGIAERKAWAQRVHSQMEVSLPESERCVVLAGQRYREFLMDYLADRYAMEGLAIGKQLRWLTTY